MYIDPVSENTPEVKLSASGLCLGVVLIILFSLTRAPVETFLYIVFIIPLYYYLPLSVSLFFPWDF